jgi:hypothetical protein
MSDALLLNNFTTLLLLRLKQHALHDFNQEIDGK